MTERPQKSNSQGGKLLGEYSESIDGNEYQGEFKGIGFIDSDYDLGSFLSSLLTELHQGIGDLKTLDMEDLFPEEWTGARVEYEIIVKATKIADSIRQ